MMDVKDFARSKHDRGKIRVPWSKSRTYNGTSWSRTHYWDKPDVVTIDYALGLKWFDNDDYCHTIYSPDKAAMKKALATVRQVKDNIRWYSEDLKYLHVLLQDPRYARMTDAQLASHLQSDSHTVCRWLRRAKYLASRTGVIDWWRMVERANAAAESFDPVNPYKREFTVNNWVNYERDGWSFGKWSVSRAREDAMASRPEDIGSVEVLVRDTREAAEYTIDSWPDLFHWDGSKQCIVKSVETAAAMRTYNDKFRSTQFSVRGSQLSPYSGYQKHQQIDKGPWKARYCRRKKKAKRRAFHQCKRGGSVAGALDAWLDEKL